MKDLDSHDILAVERFQDNTRHMIIYLTPGGKEIRRFVTDEDYQNALALQDAGEISILEHSYIIEGHIVPEPKKRRGKRRRKK